MRCCRAAVHENVIRESVGYQRQASGVRGSADASRPMSFQGLIGSF